MPTSLQETGEGFSGLRSPCPIAKVIKPAVLVRLVRSCQHAIRWRNAALRQVHLYSLRLLFHAHPPQLGGSASRVCSTLVALPKHQVAFVFRETFPILFLIIERCAPLQRSSNEARPLLLCTYDRPSSAS